MALSELTANKIRFLARSPRGLEWVSAGEIKGRLDATITAVKHREIHFELPTLDPNVLSLNAVDDLFITCGFIYGIDHTRASLEMLSNAANKMDFDKTLTELQKVRPIRHSDPFDVVGSFLGRRNYNRFEVEEAVGNRVAQQLGAVQQSHRQKTDTDISWRVHIRDNEAYVGLRISARPLHRREYKSASKGGTLHPPIASAMALLAGIQPNRIFLDPFCGMGTIPIEAARIEPDLTLFASDIDPLAVASARTNAGRANTRVNFAVADAGQLPFDYREFDRLLCNLPWQRAVEQEGLLRLGTTPFWVEVNRLLHSEGRAVVLSEATEPTDDQLVSAGLSLVLRREISIFGRWAILSILVPDSNKNPTPIDEFGRFGGELLDALKSYSTVK